MRQLASSLRPDEVSSPLVPVFWMHAVACSLALATADVEAMGVFDPAPPLGLLLLLLLLLQAVAVMSVSVAVTVRTYCFLDITNPPV